jgi:uncharacterized membrane protein (UPF0182 family)
VVFNDRIVMRETLAQALAEVFGGEVAPSEPGDVDISGDIEQLLQRADQAFADADAALQSGDLGLYQQKVSEARQQINRAMELLSELTGG